MKTDDVLSDLANWYLTHKRNLTDAEMNAIFSKHCRNESERKQVEDYLKSSAGQAKFSAMLQQHKKLVFNPTHCTCEKPHKEGCYDEDELLAMPIGGTGKYSIIHIRCGKIADVNLPTCGSEHSNPDNPKRITTVHDRFDIGCSICGFVVSAKTLNEAFRVARDAVKRHNSPDEQVTIYDRMAKHGDCQLYDLDGKCLERKQSGPEDTSRSRRVRYHKGSVDDAVRAAIQMKADHNLYVYPTAFGIAIGSQAPPFGLQHIIVKPDGTYQTVSAQFSNDPVSLSPDELAIPEFGEKLERCVQGVKAKGEAVNPYAVCRAALRREYGLEGHHSNPEKMVTLYRGEREHQKGGGVPFTLDIEVAKFYAGKEGRIIAVEMPYEELMKQKFSLLPDREIIYYLTQEWYEKAKTIEALHSVQPYHEPQSVPEALQSSMNEEETAADWYNRRAEYAESKGDTTSADLWRHVANEEKGNPDSHYVEFGERKEELEH